MKLNVGTADRIVRAVLAAGATVSGVLLGGGSVGGVVLLVVAAVLAATALLGFCPLYRLFGINTCRLPAAR